jgi:DNA-binding response OmpR family regulator
MTTTGNNSEAAASPPTVLVVEDDVLIRMAVSAYLRECGFKVIEAAGAEEARRILETDTRIDVVFSEVNIPGEVGGFGLAQRIRRERPDTKIILTSGVRRSAENAGELCEHGPVLAKPYDHRDLERRIRIMLAREGRSPSV